MSYLDSLKKANTEYSNFLDSLENGDRLTVLCRKDDVEYLHTFIILSILRFTNLKETRLYVKDMDNEVWTITQDTYHLFKNNNRKSNNRKNRIDNLKLD